MNSYSIHYAPEAEADLRELHAYIELRTSRRTATQYVRRLQRFCQDLRIAPQRGDQLPRRPGLRSVAFEERVKIVFAVLEQEQAVEILGFDYAGRQRW